MKKAVNILFLLIITSLFVTGCKTEIEANAYLSDPTVQFLSTKAASSEAELKSAESSLLDAQTKYFAAKSTLKETSDLRDTYYIYLDKLTVAQRRYSYYQYRLKYEKLAAQERYLRSFGKNPDDKAGWIDKKRAKLVETSIDDRKKQGSLIY